MKLKFTIAAISSVLLVCEALHSREGQNRKPKEETLRVFHGEGPLDEGNLYMEGQRREVRAKGDTEERPTYPTNCEEVRRQSSTDLSSGMYNVYTAELFENEERGFHLIPTKTYCKMDGTDTTKRDVGLATNHQKGAVTYARDCTDIFMYYLAGDKSTRSGVYMVYNPKWYQLVPTGLTLLPIFVYCDMRTSGGGWTIFQRRTNKNLDFYRNYHDYTNGFGAVESDYWLGLRFVNMITELRQYSLKIDMRSVIGVDSYAIYNGFKVGDDASGFALTISCYSGNDTCGNGLSYNNGVKFSTYDRDQDRRSSNCASSYRGGWWYNSCGNSNLNGDMAYSSGTRAVWWGSNSDAYVKSATSMSFRPEHYE